jgi:molybdopterin synthase catalytic subunit
MDEPRPDSAAPPGRPGGEHRPYVPASVVRDASRGHEIQHLEYEAYPLMAEREMEKIADEAAAQWPGARVAMAHRTGHLEIGEIAVVIAAVAPHRAEAFAAARFAIDTLKQRVPIWKKEVAVDGAYWVDEHA